MNKSKVQHPTVACLQAPPLLCVRQRLALAGGRLGAAGWAVGLDGHSRQLLRREGKQGRRAGEVKQEVQVAAAAVAGIGGSRAVQGNQTPASGRGRSLTCKPSLLPPHPILRQITACCLVPAPLQTSAGARRRGKGLCGLSAALDSYGEL